MEMIVTIVTYFRAQVVIFIFAGRNSGQSETKTDGDKHSKGRGHGRTTVQLECLCRGRQLLRPGSCVTTSSETARTQICPSNWIRDAE